MAAGVSFPRRVFTSLRILLLSLVRAPALFRRRQGVHWAAAISFHTLLALVPVMIIGFALIGVFQDWFDLDAGLEEMLLRRGLPDAAEQAGKVIRDLVDRVRSAQAGIGAVGVAFLIFSAFGLFNSLEAATHAVFGVSERRSHARRLLAFALTAVLFPLLAGVSLYASARLQGLALDMRDEEWVGPTLRYVVIGVPFVLTWTVFYVFIAFMPHTRVRTSGAILGAVVCGSLWELAKWAFNFYVAHSTQIDTLYGPLGILPLFIIWIHLTWVIALLGVAVARVHQDLVREEAFSRGGSERPSVSADRS